MPRQPNKTTVETVTSHFSLKLETLTDLDTIAEHLTRTTGIAHSRTDAIRYAARQTAVRCVYNDASTRQKKGGNP